MSFLDYRLQPVFKQAKACHLNKINIFSRLIKRPGEKILRFVEEIMDNEPRPPDWPPTDPNPPSWD